MHFPGDDELGSFPIVKDFSVEISESEDHHLTFNSAARGVIASFPAWEHADRDLRHFTPSDVPIGTIDEPYEDADDNWRLALFEHRGFVYVLEADDPNAQNYKRWFRVPTERYLQAWAALIDLYNPIKPLDDAS